MPLASESEAEDSMTDTDRTASLFPELPAPLAEGRGRIRPRARLLRTIGAELISSEVVAVIELVRNSYDADATMVELVFQHPEDPARASLELRDNGHGMSREVLLGPWLEPATDYKSASRTDPGAGQHSPGGRRRLGSKGVGRFAAQRLGSRLEVRTRVPDAATELIARFDWSALERDAYLDQVRVPWRESKAHHVEPHGTHLSVTRLRDHWTPERFERLRLGLSRLVSPTMTESFEIRIVINGAAEPVKAAIDANQAMYSLDGTVGPDGHCEIHYRDLNGAEEVWERTVFWPAEKDQRCGPFSFRINAWDLDREPLKLFLEGTGSKLGLRDFRRVIRDHSGVSLYRDGFRILPYGEPDNDWLRLDQRRVNNPTMRLSNNQILGTIQLEADSNPQLMDQTNREGLVTNEAYHHLTEVVRELLGYLETRRFAARRAMDIDWQRRSTALPEVDGGDAGAKIDTLVERLTRGRGDSTDLGKELRLQIKEMRDGAADAVRQYAGLASAGQLSALVFRQLTHPIRQLRSDLNLTLGDIEAGSIDEDDLEDIAVGVRRALQHLDTMEKRMASLDPFAVGGRGRRVAPVQLDDLVLATLLPFQDECHRLGVTLDFHGIEGAEVRTNREVGQQVLANLLDNAVHFACRTDAATAIVTVKVTPHGFTVSDNGPGVPAHLKNAIFEPHFTTRDGASGLGLTLVRDLLKTIGGRIRLAKSRPATFEILLAQSRKS